MERFLHSFGTSRRQPIPVAGSISVSLCPRRFYGVRRVKHTKSLSVWQCPHPIKKKDALCLTRFMLRRASMLHASGTPDCPCRPDWARAYAKQLQIIPIKRRGQRGLCIHHTISITRRMIVAHQEKHERKFSRVSFPRVAGTNSHVRDIAQQRTTLIFAADNYTSSPPDLVSADFICRPVPHKVVAASRTPCAVYLQKLRPSAKLIAHGNDLTRVRWWRLAIKKKPKKTERAAEKRPQHNSVRNAVFLRLWLRSYASRFGNGGHRERMSEALWHRPKPTEQPATNE